MADHGKGAHGLAQVVQGKADRGDAVEPPSETLAEPGMEGVLLGMPGSKEQVSAPQGGEVRMLVVRQPDDCAACPAGNGQQAVQVADGPAVAVGGAIEFAAPQVG